MKPKRRKKKDHNLDLRLRASRLRLRDSYLKRFELAATEAVLRLHAIDESLRPLADSNMETSCTLPRDVRELTSGYVRSWILPHLKDVLAWADGVADALRTGR